MNNKIYYFLVICLLVTCNASAKIQKKELSPAKVVMNYYQLASSSQWSLSRESIKIVTKDINNLLTKDFTSFAASELTSVIFNVTIKSCIIQKDTAICTAIVKYLGSIDNYSIYSQDPSIDYNVYKLVKTSEGWKINRGLAWTREWGWIALKGGVDPLVTIDGAKKMIELPIEYCKKKGCKNDYGPGVNAIKKGLKLLEEDAQKANDPEYWKKVKTIGRDWAPGAKVREYEKINIHPSGTDNTNIPKAEKLNDRRAVEQILHKFHSSDSANTDILKAVNVNDKDAVKYLLMKGIYVDTTDNHDDTALMIASEKGYADIVRVLLEHKANVNAKNDMGKTALMNASYQGNNNIVGYLISHGADINAQDKDGMSALMYASAFGYTDTVKLLLEHKANVNAKNSNGWTALIYAQKQGYANIISLLKVAGAK